jgi:hypothetical protein
VDKKIISNIAYFFAYECSDGRNPEEYMQPVLPKLKLWQEDLAGDLVKEYQSDGELISNDTRPGREPKRSVLPGRSTTL